ncbi:MAG: HK97 gp10 family phage protein [Paenisporosarcina sp.]
MISINVSGSFKKTYEFLNLLKSGDIYDDLTRYGIMGVDALSNATPRDSGETASSWRYKVTHRGNYYTIEWYNTNVEDGIPIAIILQYGHGTGTGGYVQGIDYINPAIRPIFDKIAENVWEKVKNG